MELHHFSNYILGCGSVLNVKGEVEMDAIVMDGKTLASGAVSAVRNIANPIQLARLVMDKVCMFLLTELQELCGIMHVWIFIGKHTMDA